MLSQSISAVNSVRSLVFQEAADLLEICFSSDDDGRGGGCVEAVTFCGDDDSTVREDSMDLAQWMQWSFHR